MWRNFLALFTRQSFIDRPTEADLKRWAYSEWIEYQAWIFHHSFLTHQIWQQLRDESLTWRDRPFISIVTPVFNTRPKQLQECIYSVQTQAYPHWELCLVDDGSHQADTLAYLQTLMNSKDPRVHLQRLTQNQGICRATNHAIAMARGDYIAFLDHDDRLASDALYHVAETIRKFPNTEIIYSDRDMLSPQDLRFMHLFKPQWSPETLLSGNYIFHLMVYKRELLQQLGGLRVGYEGSQDYDLVLRTADKQPKVQHIPRVLYHWRQHKQSVSMEHNVKEYAYQSGVRALQDTVQRRGLHATISENMTLWRGHYRVQLKPPVSDSYYKVLSLNLSDNYAQKVNQFFHDEPAIDSVIILAAGVHAIDNDSLLELVAWLQIPSVGLVTGKVIDAQQRLLHAGLVQRPRGLPLAVYAGCAETVAGYMAVTAIVRNVSTPHPYCCAIKRSVWQMLHGLQTNYHSPYALFDFALRALALNIRTVYTPFARFTATEWSTPEVWNENSRFAEQWSVWLKSGDPYYNPHLTLALADMGLEIRPPISDLANENPTPSII